MHVPSKDSCNWVFCNILYSIQCNSREKIQQIMNSMFRSKQNTFYKSCWQSKEKVYYSEMYVITLNANITTMKVVSCSFGEWG